MVNLVKICENCGKEFPIWQEINGKVRNLQRRKYCVDCSPFQLHNTRQLEGAKEKEEHCLKCGKKLTGNQTMFCSGSCKTMFHQSYENQKEKGVERKTFLIREAGGCCSRYGYDKNLAALQFHHLDPQQKKFKMDARNLSNRGWLSMLREFEKCIVLCANCHFEEHHPDLADWQDREVKEVL